MTRRLPFGWNELSPEAQTLLREQPDRFERVTLTDGPVAHGKLFRTPRTVTPQLDLFGDEPEPTDHATGDLFQPREN
jgi:hypothetical protein